MRFKILIMFFQNACNNLPRIEVLLLLLLRCPAADVVRHFRNGDELRASGDRVMPNGKRIVRGNLQSRL
jgi:hypothetical protein